MSGKWRAGASADDRMPLSACCCAGRVPARLTPAPVLAEFLSRLHPINSEHQLIAWAPSTTGGCCPTASSGIEALFRRRRHRLKFELECAERGMDVYMADGSVRGPVGAPSLPVHPQLRGNGQR
jgi:hypothetical protein